MNLTRTKIRFLDLTCNAGGCGCSMRCAECWAMLKVAARMQCPKCRAFRVHEHPERIAAVLRRRKAAVIGWDFTGDMFDPERQFGAIDQRFAAMALTQHLTHVVLTKRPARMREYFLTRTPIDDSHRVQTSPQWYGVATNWLDEGCGGILGRAWDRCHAAMETVDSSLPLRNVWNGVTVRNQAEADAKIPELMQVPGNRWLSIEPLWGPVDLDCVTCIGDCDDDGAWLEQIGGVIVGCDNRRDVPCDPRWVHYIVDQCRAAEVPVFVKQLNLDGKIVTDPAKFPEYLRLRQLPWTLTTKGAETP